MKRILALILILCPVRPAPVPALAQDPKPPGFRILPARDRHRIVAIDLNQKGEVLAFRWMAENGDDNVQEQAPMLFLANQEREIRIPLLKGYTASLPSSLSETGMVVGRASRPLYDNAGNRVPFPGVAFVWDEKAGIRSLGALPDDAISQADAISADGNFISGISIGPNRMRACVWQRTGETWKVTPLPQETNHLNSTRVVISPNGKFAASVDGRKPTLWTFQDDGTWTREAIGDPDSIVPRAVNDDAVIAGLRFNKDPMSTRDAVIWSRKTGIRTIERPKGYLYAELSAINRHGVAVGFADGPHGSDIGPNACVTENGRLKIFADEPEFTMATAISDKGEIAGTFEEREVVEPGLELEPPPKAKLPVQP